MEVLPGLNSLNQHSTAHVEKLSTDPQMQSQAAAMRQQIQQADEIIHNGMMHLRKLQRQVAAGQGPPATGGNGAPGEVSAIDPKTDSKIQGEIAYREAKIQSMNEQAQARLMIEQTKAAQKLAIQDAEAAAKMIQRR